MSFATRHCRLCGGETKDGRDLPDCHAPGMCLPPVSQIGKLRLELVVQQHLNRILSKVFEKGVADWHTAYESGAPDQLAEALGLTDEEYADLIMPVASLRARLASDTGAPLHYGNEFATVEKYTRAMEKLIETVVANRPPSDVVLAGPDCPCHPSQHKPEQYLPAPNVSPLQERPQC